MEPEYAAEYTTKEKWQRVAIGLAVGFVLWALFKWWLLPAFNSFVERAGCETVFGFRGFSVVFYGILVGLPLGGAVLAGIGVGPKAWRTIQSRQWPPPGLKMYGRTRITGGWPAVARGWFLLSLVAGLAILAAWGYGSASEILAQGYAAHPNGWKCAANPSLQPTVHAFGANGVHFPRNASRCSARLSSTVGRAQNGVLKQCR